MASELIERMRSLGRPLRVPAYRRLWLAQSASELGDWAARLALAIVVYDRTHSAALSAAVVTASLLPWVGLGQVGASLADRFAPKRVMICSDLLRAAVFMLLVLPVPLWVLFVGAFMAGVATPPFEAARYSLKAEVTDDDELYGAALALFGITMQASVMLGYALGGGLVAAVGARAALAVDAASFAVSAALVSGVVATRRAPASEHGLGGRIAIAAVVMVRDRVLRRCVILALVTSMAGMAIEALAAAYGRGHAGQVTLLALGVPAGALMAALFVPHAGDHRHLLRVAGTLPLIGGVAGLAVFVLDPGVPSAVLGFVAIGFGISVPIAAGPVVGRRLPASIRASAFGILQGAQMGGQALGAALGGVLAGTIGAPATCVVACSALVGVGLMAAASLPDPAVPLEAVRTHRVPAVAAVRVA